MGEIGSYFVQQGLSPQVFSYLIFVPLVATLVAFSRHIIGVRGISLYPPLLISFSLLELGITKGILLFLGIILLALQTLHMVQLLVQILHLLQQHTTMELKHLLLYL